MKTEKPPLRDRLSKKVLELTAMREEWIGGLEDFANLSDIRKLPTTDPAIIELDANILEDYFTNKEMNWGKYKTEKGWRPTVINPENLSKLVQLLSLGTNIEKACLLCGFSYISYYRFLDRNPEFRKSFDTVKESYTHYLAKRNLAVLLQEWSESMTRFYLESRDPDFKKESGVTINNNTQNNLVNVDASRMDQIFKSVEKKAKVLESWEYGKITTNTN